MDNAIEIEEVNDKTLAFYVATEKGWYPEIAKIFWKVNETKFTVIFDHGTPVLADATTGFAYERYKDLEEFNEKFPILLFLAYQHSKRIQRICEELCSGSRSKTTNDWDW